MKRGAFPTISLPTNPLFLSSLPWERLTMAAILLLAAALNLIGIDRNGLSNQYYAVTVQSMQRNWHNWFFVSFDPAGFVAVDKPPLGFWIQSISVHCFGFNGIASILPQAIAGVVSVWLLYAIVRLHFNAGAALLSAVVLAITPINVVTNRSNLLESLLILFLLGATYATCQAMQEESRRWLLVSGVLLGLAFNIKMLEAYLVVPALYGAYLVTAPHDWRTKLARMAASLAVMLGISFAWIAIVDWVPAASRPYVGSSYHNSALDLVWLYNGIQRLVGTPWTHPLQPGDPRGMPGPLRLLIPPLGDQSGWLLLLALSMVGLVAYRAWCARGQPLAPQHGVLVLWGAWLIPMLIFFSAAHFFNVYYLTLLSPAIAALVGIGITTYWSASTSDPLAQWLLGAGIVASGVAQIIILTAVPHWNPWLIDVIGLFLGILLATLLSGLVLRTATQRSATLVRVVAGVALAITLGLAPVLWTLASLHPPVDSIAPLSGPLPTPNEAAAKPPNDDLLIAYLRHHPAATTFLVATVNADTAIPILLATHAPVMAMGGYSGFDPILTPATLAERVSNHSVRFFLLPASNLTSAQVTQLYPLVGPIAPQFTNALTQWVAQHCQPVVPSAWESVNGLTATTLGTLQLFDCGG